jgi:hypothetical protein
MTCARMAGRGSGAAGAEAEREVRQVGALELARVALAVRVGEAA